MIQVQPEPAWAALCTDGHPRPFINPYNIKAYRFDVMKEMGEALAHPGEDWRTGWRRAYRKGWRAVRVKVVLA